MAVRVDGRPSETQGCFHICCSKMCPTALIGSLVDGQKSGTS